MKSLRIAIILGSARSEGHTAYFCRELQQQLNADLFDLNEYTIAPFDYQLRNLDDDFMPLIRHLIASYNIFVFATPVYWYSMSAQLKIFFDRISDLLKTDKPLARQLQAKGMAMLSCGSESFRVPGFAEPFIFSANYLNMHYLGDVHVWKEDAQEVNAETMNLLCRFAGSLTHAEELQEGRKL